MQLFRYLQQLIIDTAETLSALIQQDRHSQLKPQYLVIEKERETLKQHRAEEKPLHRP